jgi:hypothetical protein
MLARCLGVVLCLLLVSCASLRLNSRAPVAATESPMTSSPYEPEKKESCSEVGRENCRYWSNPLETVQSQCAEQVKGPAAAAGANYIHVNHPKSSVGGFATRAPVAIFYRCEHPIGS